jgi:hypothetical protein
MNKFITSSEQFDALHEAGLFEDDPKMVRRVIIDLEVGNIAKVYVERFADKERLAAGIGAFMQVETGE